MQFLILTGLFLELAQSDACVDVMLWIGQLVESSVLQMATLSLTLELFDLVQVADKSLAVVADLNGLREYKLMAYVIILAFILAFSLTYRWIQAHI